MPIPQVRSLGKRKFLALTLASEGAEEAPAGCSQQGDGEGLGCPRIGPRGPQPRSKGQGQGRLWQGLLTRTE